MTQITRFAFDLGTSSIGWTVYKGYNIDKYGEIKDKHNGGFTEITDINSLGAHIFTDGRDPQSGESLAMQRRFPRSARRRRDRFLRRQRNLIRLLIKTDLMPSEEGDRKRLERLDPYLLRAKALDERIELHELGRILFHLNQRRGYLSNRKTEQKDSDKGAINEGSKKLIEQMETLEARTVGEFYAKRLDENSHVRARAVISKGKASYDFYPTRLLSEQEFELLWESQSSFHEVLNDKLKANIKHIIFYQRPLKPIKRGKCTFNPLEERLPAFLPSVEIFRIYQDLNNLRYGKGLVLNEKLNLEQRDLLAKTLLTGKSLSFKDIKKLLKFESDISFSIEVSREKFEGNEAAFKLSNLKAFGQKWFDLTLEKQDEIVLRLIDDPDEEELCLWLQNEFTLDKDNAVHIAKLNFKDGTSRLGKTAISSILEELQEAVITYDEAAKNAGYNHSDFRKEGEKLQSLPYYAKVLERHVAFGSGDEKDKKDEAKFYGRFANPTVHIGLNQLRKLVNLLIKEHGRPHEIVIELARDLKQSEKEKDKISKLNNANQKKRLEYKATMEAMGIEQRPVDFIKMKLWEEQNNICPYSLKTIPIEDLFNEEMEIDHILPFSQTLDDSLSNKVICYRFSNRFKTNRTPYDCFSSQENWAEIAANAAQFSRGKAYRFAENAMQEFNKNNDFLARQLNDTRHLARVAKAYLECVADDVWVVTGKLTSMLRHHLGLNFSNQEHDDDGKGKKSRDDHRHHAIDSAVIGIISRSLLQKVSREAAKGEALDSHRLFETKVEPFAGFRDKVKTLRDKMIVSHKLDHGKQASLHEETAYGIVTNKKDLEIGNLVYKKPFVSLNENEIKRIRDANLRTEIVQYLFEIKESEGKIDPKKLPEYLRDFAEKKAEAESQKSAKPRNPIRHVRLLKPEAKFKVITDHEGKPYKALVPGENWCMDIVSFKNKKGGQKWEGFATTYLEAQAMNWSPRWEKERKGGKLIMRLHKGDLIEIDDKDGVRRVKKVVRLGEVSQEIYLVRHNDAGNFVERHKNPDDSFRWDFAGINSMKNRNPIKVKVNEIGKIKKR